VADRRERRGKELRGFMFEYSKSEGRYKLRTDKRWGGRPQKVPDTSRLRGMAGGY